MYTFRHTDLVKLYTRPYNFYFSYQKTTCTVHTCRKASCLISCMQHRTFVPFISSMQSLGAGVTWWCVVRGGGGDQAWWLACYVIHERARVSPG